MSGGSRSVAVIIPARDEAPVIGQAIASILAQDFPGRLEIFLVDDHSTDGTAAVATEAAGSDPRLTVIPAPPLDPGWTGKLWAMSQGVAAAEQKPFDYYLFTDADIVHGPSNVSELVARAEAGPFDIVSLMVELSQASLAERALIPAFVFFFFMLYRPGPDSRGAAGGCLLIRPAALRLAGGLTAIRGELIDDCSLAREVRRAGGRVWLGPTRTTRSIRRYATFAEIGRMISRTAFTQLRYSWLMVWGALLGMAILFLTPLALLPMILYLRTLHYYRRSLLWTLALPLIALFYMGATLHSAIRHAQGRGGEWKGRVRT
jgi:hopene-associated glycosyltransferase HpnB